MVFVSRFDFKLPFYLFLCMLVRGQYSLSSLNFACLYARLLEAFVSVTNSRGLLSSIKVRW